MDDLMAIIKLQPADTNKDGNISATEKQASIDKARAACRKKIMKVLTDEQKKQFEAACPSKGKCDK